MGTSYALRDQHGGAPSDQQSRPQLSLPGDPFFHQRHAQSRAKHDLLGRYAGAWAGIILRGLNRLQSQGKLPLDFTVDLAFLDGFAGAGRYGADADKPNPGSQDPPIWGSPVLALRAIEQEARSYPHLRVRITGVLVEGDPENHGTFDDLKESLTAADLKTPIAVRRSGAIGVGEITALRADFRKVVPEILNALPSRAMLLAFIDPFGPVMAMERMAQVIGRPKTDTIALFPYRDLARKGASALKPEEERVSGDKGNITRNDQHFGTPEWQAICCDGTLSADEKERAYVRLYINQLRQVDREVVVKEVGLRSSKDPQHTAYYLCMATRDANGALKFNELIRQTAAKEHLEIWRDQEEWLRRREAEWGQGNLLDGLDGEPIPPPPVVPFEANIEDVKAELQRRCGDLGPRPLKDVLRQMAEDVFTEGEIMKALRLLRKASLADFPQKVSVRSSVTIRRAVR